MNERINETTRHNTTSPPQLIQQTVNVKMAYTHITPGALPVCDWLRASQSALIGWSHRWLVAFCVTGHTRRSRLGAAVN